MLEIFTCIEYLVLLLKLLLGSIINILIIPTVCMQAVNKYNVDF